MKVTIELTIEDASKMTGILALLTDAKVIAAPVAAAPVAAAPVAAAPVAAAPVAAAPVAAAPVAAAPVAAAPVAPTKTIDEIRVLMGQKVAEGNFEAIRAQIESLGASNLSSIKPESYDAFFDFLKSL
jgi:hypothetical protein